MTTLGRKLCRQMVLNLSLTLGHSLILRRDLLDVRVSIYGLQPFTFLRIRRAQMPLVEELFRNGTAVRLHKRDQSLVTQRVVNEVF
jgi:hypothetical protein